MDPITRRAAVTTAVATAGVACTLALAGCGALAKIGTAAHYPPPKALTVTGRVTTVVIDGGSGGSIDVTGGSRSTVGVSQQASYSKTPPVARHGLSGTTLTLSYTCPSEVICGLSYTVQVPRGVVLRVSTGAGEITLTSLSGPVTATANAGFITAVDLRSATATLKSNAGGIVASFATAPTALQASTNLGPVTLTVPGTAAYKIGTHTLVGTSTITVRKSATSTHAITASSDVGSISISPS
jgi:hypothetical protein